MLLQPADFVLLATLLLAASAVFLFRGRSVLAHVEFLRPVVVLLRLSAALFPLWFAREVIHARLNGRSTRLIRKRYRSLRRRALRRSVEEFFTVSEPGVWHRQQFAAGVFCAAAACAMVLFTVVGAGPALAN